MGEPRHRLRTPEPTNTTEANPATVAASIQMAPRSTISPAASVTRATSAAIQATMKRSATSRP